MTLLPIQGLLLVLLSAFIAYIFRFRTPLRDRVLYFIIGCGGMIAVLDPSLTSRAAQFLGIGRGTDLILYIFVMFSLLHVVSLSTQLRRMERQITILNRRCAIADAEIGRITDDLSDTWRSPSAAIRENQPA